MYILSKASKAFKGLTKYRREFALNWKMKTKKPERVPGINLKSGSCVKWFCGKWETHKYGNMVTRKHVLSNACGTKNCAQCWKHWRKFKVPNAPIKVRFIRFSIKITHCNAVKAVYVMASRKKNTTSGVSTTFKCGSGLGSEKLTNFHEARWISNSARAPLGK